ncbi:hypothetical protein CB0940_04822 [Cercospora beticola]|uniref:Uncharacterized protein n=1 Tax=Cercospora beticola TaxID=122368 RepID=A0A2G5HK92_CERBT|nr:hypothetical protein CB0940_04822 [Cercospora beticola]PIA92958.1 hypothetical protein CB0940_04822 [Cercospora beticola]WPB02098.1 hypothetical protein RHO25_006732 [Cercospora beticola]
MAPKNDTASMPSTKPDQVDTGVSNVDDLQPVDSELIGEEKMLREQTKKLIEEGEKLAAKRDLLREAMARLWASRMRLPEDRAPTEEETAASDILFDSVETLFKEAGEEEHFNHLRELAGHFENMTAEELAECNKQVEKLGQLDDDAKIEALRDLLKTPAQNKDERMV